ncbi:MAG: glycosyl hydrolase family 5 [Acetobacteraceae bacterium]|nr:glycosyl hydrolase family 5 [Acetobacteraceae bacterium]
MYGNVAFALSVNSVRRLDLEAETRMCRRPGASLPRRAALGFAGAVPALASVGLSKAGQVGAGPPGGEAAFRAEWRSFLQRYVAEEGRVVDTGNGGISHSEGQGWALLFAEHAGDRAAFDRILSWTERALRRERDALHAWRYRPGAPVPVDDPNNATDGDICVAWSLVRASRRWANTAYLRAGKAIARDILRVLLRQAGPFTVLLPGAGGFEDAETLVVNPSYYVFPAFDALTRALPDPRWPRLAQDGLRLLRHAAFGRWGLPPDWLRLAKRDGAASLPDAWPPRFSYDAVRVPLYVAWAGLDEPVLARAAAFWSDATHRLVPAWADLATDAVSPYAASPGTLAVAQFVLAGRSQDGLAVGLPPVSAAPDYFAAALTLLARLAAAEQSALRR